jgi:hypothetical protein
MLAVAVVAVVADAIIQPRAGVAPKRASSTPAVRADHTTAAVVPGAAAAVHEVLYRFVTAYGNLSGETAASRYQTLVSLAAPPLLTQLRSSGVAGQSVLFDGGPSIQAKILNLQVFGPIGRVAHGAVDIETRATGAKAAYAAPLRTSFVANLVEVGSAWKVSNFTLVP